MPTGIPEQVKSFIRRHLNSIEQLEIFLLLRSSRNRSWTATEISNETRSVRTSAAKRLEDLTERGLLQTIQGREPGFKYGPRTAELDLAAHDLVAAYALYRFSVMDLNVAQPPDATSASRQWLLPRGG
jgi:hypothetical protein